MRCDVLDCYLAFFLDPPKYIWKVMALSTLFCVTQFFGVCQYECLFSQIKLRLLFLVFFRHLELNLQMQTKYIISLDLAIHNNLAFTLKNYTESLFWTKWICLLVKTLCFPVTSTTVCFSNQLWSDEWFIFFFRRGAAWIAFLCILTWFLLYLLACASMHWQMGTINCIWGFEC